MFFMGNGHISSDWGLMGGYPAASGYRFAAHMTGLEELIAEGKPIPLGGDTDPENPVWDAMMPGAKMKRDKQAITTEEMFSDYDLYLNYMRGGPASATRWIVTRCASPPTSTAATCWSGSPTGSTASSCTRTRRPPTRWTRLEPPPDAPKSARNGSRSRCRPRNG